MESVSKYCLVLITLGILILCVSPAVAQSGSHTTIQVYTDEAVLGRIVSITSDSDIGAYSITITRGMGVFPAQVGDTLKDKDIIILQQGSYANLQLADRNDQTMLAGSPGGTAVLIEKAGSKPGSMAPLKATDNAQIGKNVYVEPAYAGELGRITSVMGDASIVRTVASGGGRVIPAAVSETLLDGDILHVTKGYAVVALADARVLTVYEGEKLSLHEKGALAPESFLDPVINHPLVKQVSSFFDEKWRYLKHVLAGESFEVVASDGKTGVRG